MKYKPKRYNAFQRLGRAFRLNFIKLFRSPGGAKKVSLGFAIGFGLEMIVLSSVSLVYIIFVPVVRLANGSLPAAIIGNVVGKITFLPVILIPFAKKLGKLVYPIKVKASHGTFSFSNLLNGEFQELIHILYSGIHVLIGMSIFGAILGTISYFFIYHFYEKTRMKRINKLKNAQIVRKIHVS